MADREDNFLSRITGKRKLRELRERQGEVSFWAGVAMLGLVGWMIVIPTMVGIFLGRWLDQTLRSGLFWTLSLMMIGLAAGCYNAWRAIQERQ